MEFLKINKNFAALALFVAYIAYCLTDAYYTIVCVKSLINAIAVMGIVIVSGYTRQIHLGQAAFIGVGAYTSAVLMIRLDVSFWATIPIAIILTALIGIVLGIPTLKLSDGPYLALVTLIFGEIIFILCLNLENVTGGAFGLSRIPSPMLGELSLRPMYRLLILTAVFTVIAYIVANRIVSSKYGRFFLSIRESEAAAQSVGINTMKYRIIAFAIASAYGGLAGVFYAQCFRFLNPEQFRWNISLTLISMAIIGGIRSLPGGVLGAIALTILPEVLRGFTAQMRMITYGLLVILVLTFLPNGLISLVGKWPSEILAMLKERLASLSDARERKKSRIRT